MTSSRPSRISRFETLDSDFVGRRRELSILDAALREARAGLGSILLLSGEAGIGKTLLVKEFSAFARTGGAKVLAGRASLRFRDVPFGVWKQILSEGANGPDALRSIPCSNIESSASITTPARVRPMAEIHNYSRRLPALSSSKPGPSRWS